MALINCQACSKSLTYMNSCTLLKQPCGVVSLCSGKACNLSQSNTALKSWSRHWNPAPGELIPTQFNERKARDPGFSEPGLPVRRTSGGQAGSWKESPVQPPAGSFYGGRSQPQRGLLSPAAQEVGGWPHPIPPLPLPLPSVWAPSSVRPAHPHPLGRKTNRAGTEQDRTECPLGRVGLEGGPCLPPARREGMGVTAGSLHPSNPACPLLCLPLVAWSFFRLQPDRTVPSPLPIRPVGGAAGLLLGGEVDAIPRSGLWFLEGTASLPRVRLPWGGSQGRNQREEGRLWNRAA